MSSNFRSTLFGELGNVDVSDFRRGKGIDEDNGAAEQNGDDQVEKEKEVWAIEARLVCHSAIPRTDNDE